MSIWDQVIGQERAVETLKAAAKEGRDIADGKDSPHRSALAHAWLITGPPGSGRSLAARCLGAALQCTGPEPGCGQCAGCTSSLGGSNMDVHAISTDLVQYKLDDIREWIPTSYTAPANGRWRVIIIEDADRMDPSASNLLLKAIEEPPERTIWILSAPTEGEVLPTIRSRSRSLVLRTPSANSVADYLAAQEGVPRDQALQAAKLAQSHVGLARALLKNPQLRQRRRSLVELLLSAGSVPEAVLVAQKLLERVKEQAGERTDRINAEERQKFLRQWGVEEGEAVPKTLRPNLRELEEDQKRRSRRGMVDLLDQTLVDLLGFYRDVLTRQLGADVDLVHIDLEPVVEQFAKRLQPQDLLGSIAAVEKARERLQTNAAPQLVLEALVVTLVEPSS